MASDETDLKTRRQEYDDSIGPTQSNDMPVRLTPRRMSFFDVGGLLGSDRLKSRTGPDPNPLNHNISMQPLLRLSATEQRPPTGTRVLLDDLGAMPERVTHHDSLAVPNARMS